MQGKQQLFFGATNGETFRVDESTFSDDGNPIAIRVRTKDYYLSGQNRIDEVENIFVYADEPQATNVSIRVDKGNYEFLGSVQQGDEPERFDYWDKCYSFSIGFDEVSSNNVKLKGFNIIYSPQPEML